MKKILLALLIGVTMLSAETTLATVGALSISDADLKDRLDNLPPQYAAYYSSEEGKAKLLKQLIDEKLLFLEAKANGYSDKAEVNKMTERFKQDVMTNLYLKEQLKEVSVTDKDIKDYYETNKTRFSQPESVRASHILVKTEAEANKLLGELNKGAAFEDVAKKNSTCPSAAKGGDLDFFTRGQMVKPFEDAAFALKVGDITKKPVQTQFGWHIIKLTDRKAAQQKALEDVQGDIRNELMQEKQKESIDSILKKLEEKYPVKK
jgi:peptidyl-prolyl cis-trans isomerase C